MKNFDIDRHQEYEAYVVKIRTILESKPKERLVKRLKQIVETEDFFTKDVRLAEKEVIADLLNK